jgi:hypothetical protein
MNLALNDAERLLIVELLQADFQSVRTEIHHADSHDAKEILRSREALIRMLLERLQAPLMED